MFAFKVKDGPGGKEATWVVDVKNGKGSVSNDPGKKLNGFLLSLKVFNLSSLAYFSYFLPHG